MAPSGKNGEGQRQRDKGKKRKRQSKYLQHGGKKSVISAGVQGFLITCENGKERQSVKEAINLLEQFLETPDTRDGPPAIEDERAASHVDPAVTGTDAKNDHASSSKTDSPNVLLDSKVIACDSTCTTHLDSVTLVPDSTTVVPDNAQNPGGSTSAENGVDQRGYSSSEETEAELDGEESGWVKCRRLDESGSAKKSSEAVEDGAAGQGSNLEDQKEQEATGETSRSFDELLAAELEELRDPQKARFVGYETGCHGVIFIRMLPQDGTHQKGPKELAEAIVKDAAVSKKSRSRFCMRLLPVELTCYASTSELKKAAEPLISRHFPKTSDQPSFKFAVICESRANSNLNKMDFVHAVAKMVPEPHKVDLSNPDKTIIVQIVKTSCAIGVVQNFKELGKYNLRQLTSPQEKKTA